MDEDKLACEIASTLGYLYSDALSQDFKYAAYSIINIVRPYLRTKQPDLTELTWEETFKALNKLNKKE